MLSTERPEHGPPARYRQIARILARHGFGYLATQLGLGYLAPSRWGLAGERRPPTSLTQAQRMRLVFEDLGTTFVKLGQILSSRTDLLPPELAAELSRLQDAVPAEPPEVVEEAIERELGRPSSAVFDALDPQPLGSASIGQVHTATLTTGEEVVIKVQRPRVEERVGQDLAVMMDLARTAQTRTSWGRVYNLLAIVEEFAETLRGELDYVREARNAERIRHNFSEEPALRVPAIYWPYTTRRLLTMERLHGIKIGDTAALRAAGTDLHVVAASVLRVSLKMILEDGFYHADPHPGNFYVAPDGTIGLLDFGMVGVLDEQARQDVLYLLLAIIEQDVDRVIDQLLALGIVGTTRQIEHLKRDVAPLVSPPWGQRGDEADVHRFLEGLLAMASRRRLLVPAQLLLMCKTIMMHEALARRSDPDFQLAEVLGPYARRLALQSLLPKDPGKRLLQALLDLGQLALSLPRRVRRLLLQAEQGHISVNMRIQETEYILESLNRMVNRLVLAIVAAGLLVALALLLQAYSQGLQWLIGTVLAVAFAGAVGFAVWVIVTTLRRRHH